MEIKVDPEIKPNPGLSPPHMQINAEAGIRPNPGLKDLHRKEIEALAHAKWKERTEKGEEGTPETDWFAAEEELRGR